MLRRESKKVRNGQDIGDGGAADLDEGALSHVKREYGDGGLAKKSVEEAKDNDVRVGR